MNELANLNVSGGLLYIDGEEVPLQYDGMVLSGTFNGDRLVIFAGICYRGKDESNMTCIGSIPYEEFLILKEKSK